MNYNPLTDPFDLPVQTLRFDCAAERPLQFSTHSGATPGTTLWGAFGDALLAQCCIRRENGRSDCGDAAGGCLAQDLCPGRWLYKPRSILQNRDLARPVLLHSRDLEQDCPVQEFRIDAILWGRHAIAALELVCDLLHHMGEQGLKPEQDFAEPVRFQIGEIRAETPGTLADRAASLLPFQPKRFRLTFETPFLGEKKRKDPAGGLFSLADILGGCAFDLAAWDLEDRELGPDLPKPRHKLCLDARDAARQAAESVRPLGGELAWCDTGKRISRTNNSTFRLQGFVGQAEFSGYCAPILPWLTALSLGGGGAKRPWGFGRVRVEWQSADWT